MKHKNIAKYLDKYKYISKDQLERINDFLIKKPFTKKDSELFYNAIEQIMSIEENYIKIVLDIIPEPTPRPRMSRFGTFYVKNTRTNNEFIKCIVNEDKDLYHYVTTPCRFIVENYFPIPSSMTKVETLLAELKLGDFVSLPDWDNLGKTYSDMIQKYILANDSLITEGISRKFYSLKPRVEITIIYKTKHTLNYSKRLIERSKSYKKDVGRNNEKIKHKEN